jgi:DNA ligase-1
MFLQPRSGMRLLRTTAFHGSNNLNILNISPRRFFFATKPGNINKKKEIPSEEEMRRRKERKAENARKRNAKPEIKARKKESDRVRNSKPEIKERKKETNRIYRSKPEIKERIKQTNRIHNAKTMARVVQKKKKMDPYYVYNPQKERSYNWKDEISVKSFFEKVGEKLKIVDESDWYHVSNVQIRENGGSGALSRHKTLGFALKFAYPDYPWDMELFQYHKKLAAQRYLRIMLEGLLPKEIVLEYNFTKDPALYLEGSTSPSQYDFFIKEWRLAIEYQGEQHYLDIRPVKSPLSERLKRDAAKLASAVKHGIILVYIPYWWDRTRDSLSSTLHQYLPDKFLKTASPPIPTELPPDYKKIKKPGILTNKNIMMGYDYEPYENQINVKGWFMSEKLDGIRAYWDGKGNFWSKNAKIINVPESFKQLPPFPLDGELWCGYEDNQTSMVFLKMSCGAPKKIKNEEEMWEKVKFCVFDAPQIEGSYDKRHLFLKQNFTKFCNNNISLIPMQKCKGKEHLQEHLEKNIKKGGEGIMIYNPVAHYHPGRCKHVLKVKKYYESTITFLERSSKGGTLFKCLQNNGSEVWLKVTGGYWKRKPEVGSKIPVKHQGFFADSHNFKYPVLFEPLTAHEKKQARKQEKMAKKPNINIE